jgi:hypothetical protein
MPEFDFSALMNNPMLQYGMGLLKASGPSTQPHSFGQDLASAYDYMGNHQLLNAKIKQQGILGGGDPSSVREFQFFNSLDPEAQKKFLSVKRQPQHFNLGDRVYVPGSDSTYMKAPPPQDMPAFKGAQKAATLQSEITTNAQANLPGAVANAEVAISNIDRMIGNPDVKNLDYPTGIPEHPGLVKAVGPLSSKLPTIGDDAADFESRLEQAAGGAFLEAFESLKGGGAITEVEGAKATAAKTRMRLATSERGFREAAKEYRDIIAKGVERAKAKAAGVPFSGMPDMGGVLSGGGQLPQIPGVPPGIMSGIANSPAGQGILSGQQGQGMQMPPRALGAQVNPPVAFDATGGQVPQGVDPQLWQHMTPEERALWLQ